MFHLDDQIYMPEKILFIDDNENILDSIRRQLRGKFSVETACSAKQALERLETGERFAIVVSDMKMPGMDGVELLEAFRSKSPFTTRLMLTGNIDQTTAVQAVNRGNVFRFLNKPVDQIALESALNDAMEIHLLRMAEKELLNDTLKGTVEILSELLSFVDPNMFGQVSSLKLNVKEVSKQLNMQDSWELEVAALLSQIGMLALPLEIRVKKQKGEPLTEAEQKIYVSHPGAAYKFLKAIPRLEGVAEMVRYQSKNWDGSGFPADNLKGEEIPIGARVLHVLNEYHIKAAKAVKTEEIFSELLKKQNEFDSEAVGAIHAALLHKEKRTSSLVGVSAQPGHLNIPEISQKSTEQKYSAPEKCKVQELAPGYIAVDEIRSKNGVLILAAGNRISDVTFERIKNYHTFTGIKEPLVVIKPL